MPKLLPLPMIFVQRLVIEANSPGLKLARKKGVSVTLNPVVGAPCSVVPNACIAPTNGKAAVPASAALLVQEVPLNAIPAPVLTSFTTTEFGRTPVSVLLVRSLVTDSETKPFGVIRQEQQEISCSSGENA